MSQVPQAIVLHIPRVSNGKNWEAGRKQDGTLSWREISGARAGIEENADVASLFRIKINMLGSMWENELINKNHCMEHRKQNWEDEFDFKIKHF